MKSDAEEVKRKEPEGELEKLVRDLGMADLFPEHADMFSKVSSGLLRNPQQTSRLLRKWWKRMLLQFKIWKTISMLFNLIMEDIENLSYSLIWRAPATNITLGVEHLMNMIEDEETKDTTKQKIDQPLTFQTDSIENLQFLKCEYNRDGTSYWSPYTNKYFPEIEEEEQAYHPNAELW